jgi:hypothetical protein
MASGRTGQEILYGNFQSSQAAFFSPVIIAVSVDRSDERVRVRPLPGKSFDPCVE